jgi:hypothetical protein
MADIAVDAAAQVLSKNLTDQGLFIAGLTIVLGAALAVYGIKMLQKRDKVVKDVGESLTLLSTKMAGFTELQSIDHQATIKNRDLLQEQGESIAKIELGTYSISQVLQSAVREIQEHAKLCIENHYKILMDGRGRDRQ